MAAELIRLYEENPDERRLRQVVECLRDGGVVIYPTDTVYGIGCDIFNHKAVQKVAQLKGVKAEKANFAIICHDLSNLAEYARSVGNPVYKVMRKALPGPFTFILNASSKVPKLLNNKKKTIGIRVPNHSIPRLLVERLGNPIITTSIHDEDEVVEYSTDPELIYEKYKDLVDIIIDGGYGDNEPSTVVDCSGDFFEVIREGKGKLDEYL
jgi:tRNA threonylcarbamoyl adenosine modification protein (Sua5/YciO/YrdC/YwlC family)